MMQLRKIKVLTFFFLSFVCSQTTVYGQMISGKIIDAEQLPIDGATIILQAMDSTYIAASISNTDGIFVFNSQQEEYRLIIQHILYETKQMAGKGNDVGTIQLQPKDYALDEIIIKAERPFVKVKNGLLGYNLAVLTQNQLSFTEVNSDICFFSTDRLFRSCSGLLFKLAILIQNSDIISPYSSSVSSSPIN